MFQPELVAAVTCAPLSPLSTPRACSRAQGYHIAAHAVSSEPLVLADTHAKTACVGACGAFAPVLHCAKTDSAPALTAMCVCAAFLRSCTCTRCCRASRTATRTACCTATSSLRTCSSTATTTRSSWPTSAWRARLASPSAPIRMRYGIGVAIAGNERLLLGLKAELRVSNVHAERGPTCST